MKHDLVSFIPASIAEECWKSCEANPTDADHAVFTEARFSDFEGAVVFCDISGFTKLSERLAKEGADGPERLVAFLNEYFGMLISIVTGAGGDVVKFAGDALLAVWKAGHGGDTLAVAARRAAQCALDLQSVMNRKNEPDRPRLHMGVGAGQLSLLVVGGTYDRWDFLVCGAPLTEIEAAVKAASPDLVVASFEAWTMIADDFEGAVVEGSHYPDKPLTRLDKAKNRISSRSLICDVLTRLEAGSLPGMEQIGAAADGRSRLFGGMPVGLARSIKQFVPGAIQKHIAKGDLRSWVPELRSVAVLFINVEGLPMESSACVPVVHAVVLRAQKAIYKQAGGINKILLDDKGFVILAGLGLPPLSHEDNSLRAVKAALHLQEELADINVRSSIGITTGQVFCGIVGSDVRREYTMMGDTVNTAARIMAGAKGGINTDENTAVACQGALPLVKIGSKQFKGKMNEIAIYAPKLEGGFKKNKALNARKMKSLATMQRTNLAVVGRAREMALITGAVESLYESGGHINNGHGGAGGVIVFDGERGIGKSRLLEEGKRMALNLGGPTPNDNELFAVNSPSELGNDKIVLLTGRGDPDETRTPYHAWKQPFSELLDIPADTEQRKNALLSRVQCLVPQLTDDVALLNDIFGVNIAEGGLAGVSADERKAKRSALMVALFVAGVCVPRADFNKPNVNMPRTPARPTMIIMQDLHWFDAESLTLLTLVTAALPDVLAVLSTGPFPGAGPSAEMRQQLAKKTGALEAATAVASYGDFASAPVQLQPLLEKHSTHYIKLDPLPATAIVKLVCDRLGVSSLPAALAEFIKESCAGNPFFAQEIASAMVDAKIATVVNGQVTLSPTSLSVHSLAVPPSLQGVINGRLDRLTPSELLSLKVASAIGPQFTLSCIQSVFPTVAPKNEFTLAVDLATLCRLDLISVSAGHWINGEAKPTAFAFKNPFTMAVAYNLMLIRQRMDLHKAIAEWMEANKDTLPAEEVEASLANQYRSADINDPVVMDKCLLYLDLAAAAAITHKRPREAEQIKSLGVEVVDKMLAKFPGDRGRILRAARYNREMAECVLGSRDTEYAELARPYLVRGLEIIGGTCVKTGVPALMAALKAAEENYKVDAPAPTMTVYPASPSAVSMMADDDDEDLPSGEGSGGGGDKNGTKGDGAGASSSSAGAKPESAAATVIPEAGSKEPLKELEADGFFLKEGYLFKKGSGGTKSWQRRWFLLGKDMLVYSKKESERGSQTIAKAIVLKELRKIAMYSIKKRPFCFQLSTDSRSYNFSCASQEELDNWINLIQQLSPQAIRGPPDAGTVPRNKTA